jgi:hypothetical protein
MGIILKLTLRKNGVGCVAGFMWMKSGRMAAISRDKRNKLQGFQVPC